MAQDSYRTIKNRSRGLFKDRGSKFLSFAFPVTGEEEIKEILDNLRREYHDARHHCYAWRIGADGKHFRANDDGEPSGTAGRPILKQIQKLELTNIMIVVIRYFGGTLLGTGGLVNAYRSAAADALEKVVIIIKTIDVVYEIRFPYAVMNNVMRVIKEEQAEHVEHDFEGECKVRVTIPREREERFTGRMNSIGQANVKKLLNNY